MMAVYAVMVSRRSPVSLKAFRHRSRRAKSSYLTRMSRIWKRSASCPSGCRTLSASPRSLRTTRPRKRSIFRPKNRKRRLKAKERARFDVYITGEQLRGNAYVVSDGETTLLLECGLSFRELQKRLGYGVADITACLVSHEHQDHAKAAAQMLKAGVRYT
ncbi:MAG: MBL fold metallo-hydrolase [Butyricicoccaceae bacterium]